MASRRGKRPPSPALIPNPLVKKRNLQWTLLSPASPAPKDAEEAQPASAAIESGAALITDHLAHFTAHLASHILPSPPPLPSVPSYASLYGSSAGKPHGAHFVVHQHDHPVAGTHYDLRLQINGASSVSWAIMYGLPGDPNSKRLNRNATETRVHSLWNHLVETALPRTGSLLIWDTGTYAVLPRRSKHAPRNDPSSPGSSPPSHDTAAASTQQALLEAAFRNRKIRLRLHGARLPDPYVLNLRLTKSEDASGRAKSLCTPRARRRRGRAAEPAPPETSDPEDDDEVWDVEDHDDKHVVPAGEVPDPTAEVSALERELPELGDEQVRRTNAYPGASNSIGSVHQRRWYLSLDRPACGFVEEKRGGRTVWELSDSEKGNVDGPGSDTPTQGKAAASRLKFPFYVRGPEHEHSVVTGRRGEDILRDEGVTGFVRRMGWAPVLN
ncbi:hypothetical protein TOPH_03986 [Tolypocladium ophioglossoides CBS 100239]|uniref:DNA ligase D 3'-phosphoesterase domain-containing protein n=1 Tax=Tolypocladium ophioglossoides (strain CBS 100239) TaxID=1163406 RepID=A0A0L0NB66_TOLOC|nr:hypothetical protein TOPH_03986 [Tolypocladium ophioglossoides CBS 100239]